MFTAAYIAKLALWHEAKAAATAATAHERALRMEIFGAVCPAPVEGTNTVPLENGSGYVLKITYPIDRKVDTAIFEAHRDYFVEHGIPRPDDLIVRKPELKISAYRELTADEMRAFDICLTVKPGMPSFEVIKPKR